MAWIYGDYGTAALGTLVSPTQIRGGLTVPIFFRDNSQFVSKTSCFYKFANDTFNVPVTNEFWLMFDLFVNESSGSFSVFAGNATGTGGVGSVTGYTGVLINSNYVTFYNYNSKSRVTRTTNSLQYLKISTYLLHMKSGVNDGICELWTNDRLSFTYTGNVNNGNLFEGVTARNNGSSDGYYSCILVSNEQISNTYPVVSWREILDLDCVRQITNGIDVSVDVDVIRKIVDCVFDLDVERNISAELIFSPLETEELFHGSSAALKLKSGLRASGTITATSFDSNEIEQNTMSERNTSGTQSVEINIAEQQLTD